MAEKKHNASLYRAMHQLRKGNLHRALGIPEGDTIPAEKLEVKEGDSEHTKHMKNFAKTMKGFSKK
jgi:hypothetical protein